MLESARGRRRDSGDRGSSGSRPLELFFDLVFVLSFTQVTAKIADDPTWEGLGEGMLVLAAVWWAWARLRLAHQCDRRRPERQPALHVRRDGGDADRLAGDPGGFGDEGLLFGCAYFFVRAMHLILYVRNTRQADDDDNLGAILRLTPGLLLSSALFIVGGALDGDARTLALDPRGR